MPIPEILGQLIGACEGMTIEQVQEQIATSEIADKVTDPAALAALLVKCASDPDYAAHLMTGGDPDAGDEAEAPGADQPMPPPA
jgi:hypothetical protein